jgi:hypothetical protein
MAQSGFTPIRIYYSSTPSSTPNPLNLTYGELAINITDGKLYYLDGGNTLQTIAYKNVPISTLSGAGTGVLTALGVNTGSAGAFVVNGGALGTPASGTVTNLTGTASININGTVGATTANTGTFTRLVSGVTTVSGTGTITPVSDNCNQINVFIVGGDISFLAPSGTPASGQKLLIRITGDTLPRNITSWNAIYRVVGTTLPTTVAANKTVYVGCIYNESATKWDVVAVTIQA